MGLICFTLYRMSYATDTLAIAKQAYQNALSGKSVALNGKRFDQHEINDMLRQVDVWQERVKDEQAAASGTPRYRAIRTFV